MLELDADKRITAEQALAHPYLAQYADPTDEPTSLPYDQTFEDLQLTVDQWKGKTKRSRRMSKNRLKLEVRFSNLLRGFGLLYQTEWPIIWQHNFSRERLAGNQ